MHVCMSSEMGRERFKFNYHGIALLYSIILTSLRLSVAIVVPGFLNIDCGSGTSAPYEDSRTKLTWENDDRFTQSGTDKNVSNADPHYDQNSQALSTFRHFAKTGKRHCYELHLTRPNTSFLIRAMFFFPGGLDPVDLKPSKFDLAIGATVWYTVQSDGDLTVIAEGIFYSPGATVNFCIIEREETVTSFISSLELRELDREGKMYSFEGSRSMYFVNLRRSRFNPDSHDQIIRYPDDPYDRFWYNTRIVTTNFTDVKYITNSTAIKTNTGADVNYIPVQAMLGAGLFNNSESQYIAFDINAEYKFIYGIFYFQDLKSSSERGNFTLSFSGHNSPPLNIGKNGTSMYAYPYIISQKLYLELKFESENKSERLACLNAVESYKQGFFDFTTTDPADDRAIQFLREVYSMKSWEGDPCLPIPFSGLSCDLDFSKFYAMMYISSINLSSLGRHINMSTRTNDDIALGQIDTWSLTHSNADNKDFDIIVNHLLKKSVFLLLLDFSYNNITEIPPAALWPSYVYPETGYRISPEYLNFSNNNIQGEMISFDVRDTAFFSSLKELNLSYNHIISLPASCGNESNAALPWLTKLDISHNLITQDVSFLKGILDTTNSNINWSNVYLTTWANAIANWSTYSFNVSSLVELHASNNHFGGTFDSVLYFSTLKALKLLNFDNNIIEGVLNLTLWIESWQQQAHNYSDRGAIFSLRNNSISAVNPSAKDLESILLNLSHHFRYFNESWILLDGNPFCTGIRNPTLFAYKYFCNIPWTNSKKSKLLIIILSSTISGGALVILIITARMSAAIIWRLRKQVEALQRIQDELDQRKVQPLFFSFSEIKVATTNFGAHNMIGKGGYGIVYKGILRDGTTVAVKKLINLEQVQMLDDFLNEVVLVSGIKHKNLIQLKGCCIKNQDRMLVYDYAEQGNLEQALFDSRESQPLDMETRINICIGIARGLYYLHGELQPRIIHRDIKPANILLDQNFNTKIADFGLARLVAEGNTGQITRKAGTWGYLAPE